MFFRQSSRRHDDDTTNKYMREVNMTPLIDVSLVLVVMLLLATPLAFESNIALRNSQESGKQAQQDTSDRIEITIVSDVDVEVNRTTVARDELATYVRPLLERSTTGLVVVRCGDDVSHGTFVDVIDQAKICGAAEIAVVGR